MNKYTQKEIEMLKERLKSKNLDIEDMLYFLTLLDIKAIVKINCKKDISAKEASALYLMSIDTGDGFNKIMHVKN